MAYVIDKHMKQKMATEFLTDKEICPTEIHRHLNSVYGEQTADVIQ
jgi:hypothetical protein